MSLNLNNLFGGVGLAQLAGNSVGRLGLEATPIDVGAPMRGQAKGILAALELQQKREELANEQLVQHLKNQGNLDNTQLKGFLDTQKEIISQTYQDKRAQVTAAIQQQQADQLGQHYKNQDQMALQNFGLDQAYKSADIGIRQQTADQSGQYQKGLLEESKAKREQEAQFKAFDYMVTQKKENNLKVGSLATMLAQAQQIPDDAQRVQTTNALLKFMKENGASDKDLEMLGSNDPQSIQMYAAMLANTAQASLTAQSKAKAQGMTFKMVDGKAMLVPDAGQATSEFDKQLGKSQAQAVVDADKQLVTLKDANRDLQDTYNELMRTPEDLLGPVDGILSHYTSKQAQILEGKLNNVTLALKNQLNLGSQGFTDSDRKFLTEVSGSLKNYKGSTKELLSYLINANRNAQASQWLLQDKYMKQSANYDNWKQNNPAPMVQIQRKDDKGKPIGQPESYPIDEWLQHESEARKAGWEQI